MNPKIAKLLKDLGLPEDGTFSDDGCFTVEVKDSEQFSKFQSKLDRSDLVEADDDLSVIEGNVVYSVYDADGLTLNLIGNLDDDTYKLVVEEVE